MSSAARGLRRAIGAGFSGFSGLLHYEELASRDWASATFVGEQHRIRLRLEGKDVNEAAARFLDGLGEREFNLGRHILIGIEMTTQLWDGDAAILELEAVTVEAD